MFPLLESGMPRRIFGPKCEDVRGGPVNYMMRSFFVYYHGYQMREHGMNGACSAHVKENYIQNFSRNLKRKTSLGRPRNVWEDNI
jgi:hypothetical protein